MAFTVGRRPQLCLRMSLGEDWLVLSSVGAHKSNWLIMFVLDKDCCIGVRVFYMQPHSVQSTVNTYTNGSATDIDECATTCRRRTEIRTRVRTLQRRHGKGGDGERWGFWLGVSAVHIILAHGSQSGIESIRRSIFRPKESFACLSFLQSQLISLLSKRLGGRS